MTNSDSERDGDPVGEDDFNPPGPVARDHVISSQDTGDFEKPAPVTRDHIIKYGVPDDPDEERGA